jgi:hypothetical protein
MKLKSKMQALFAGVALSAGMYAQAATIVIDFDAVTTGASVDQFYNGGTDSLGGSGTNLGVEFINFVTTTGFGQTSQPNLAYNGAESATANIQAGFSSLSFTDGVFGPSSIQVYSGLNGTGSLLGSSALSGSALAFAPGSVAFSGIAHSFVVVAAAGTAGLDDVTITAVPEPESYAMLLAGLAVAGWAARRQQRA